MPDELVVNGEGNLPIALVALQEEWYQDVVTDNVGELLRIGVEWDGASAAERALRFSLSGRDLYILAPHDELNGFVSVPRLKLQEEHVVLCADELLNDVRAAIASTHSPEGTLLTSEWGIPSGWVAIRGVVPRKSLIDYNGDILDALKPRPDIEIALIGGIRIDRQTWLSGFPPSIRVRGDPDMLGELQIDGRVAELSEAGVYTAPGWDSLGAHSISSASTARTYAISEGAEQWEPWDAYKWSLGEFRNAAPATRQAICGAFVRAPEHSAARRTTIVAASNPILIGARPGDIEFCLPRTDLRADVAIGFPCFEPIWALPADALHCDKRIARVLLIGTPKPVNSGRSVALASAPRTRRNPLVQSWCSAITAAGAKGLVPDSIDAAIAALWKHYKEYARSLRKRER